MPKNFQMIYDTNNFLLEKVGKKKYRSVQITGASCLGNLFIGVGKLVIGIVSLSFFTCVSAFYTFGMVMARICALRGLMGENDPEKQYRYYKVSGMILMIASVLYVGYSARLLWHPMTNQYHLYVALGIASFTFTELGLNIRGVILERHNHTLLFHAIRMINLASSLICLVLTQTALLSVTRLDMPDYDLSKQNGIIGILMGMSATMIGCIMLWRVRKLKRKKEVEETS